MENSYREILLGSEAIDYLEKCLSYGKTLSKFLLQKHNLSEGKIITLVPAYATEDQIEHFDWGIHKEPPPETHIYYTDEHGRTTRAYQIINMEFWLVNVIEDFLSVGETRCCIFEELLARLTDSSIGTYKTKLLNFNDEIYHFLSLREAEKEIIEQSISQSYGGFPFIGIMTSTDKERLDFYSSKEEPIGKINSDDLEIFAQRAKKIFVGAYDFEGFLIWSKD